MKIGISIKNLRTEKGLSQEELASLIAISRTSLSQIENNIKSPSKTTLAKISKALEVPEVYFYLLSLDRDDVAEDKQSFYDAFFPSIQEMVKKIVL